MSTSDDGHPEGVSSAKSPLTAIQSLKARLLAVESGPIAIVGAGLRLPGGVDSLEAYWSLLLEGRDATREVPADRWDADAWTDTDPDAPGKMITRRGGFLDDVATFDAAFFGISPREALELDPSQRLLLQVAWEALERAAIAPDRLDRSATGVYVGLGLSDYGRRHFLGPDPTRMTAYSGTGSFLSVAAGRIAYTLGLQGPAMTVDTACSASLVAVHLAVEALRRGEVDLALAGGANVICAPEPSVYFSKLQATSADGRCKTFDAGADGYGRGEGAAVVALKRLADAVEAGDPILAVIRGTAVNHDGRSNGLTAPNGAAQQAVIRKALENAGVAPEQIGYVEAHGTGTPLGDPIEVEALAAVFGERPASRPLRVGSVKTNLGHLETAAGVVGLLKLALCVQRGFVPPHLHLRELNPRIRLRGLEIPTDVTAWGEDRRLGGVSSFGLSGTNAHVVLEQAPAAEPAAAAERTVELVALSARSDAALGALADRWSGALAEDASGALAPAARTAGAGRAWLPSRVAVVARTEAEASARLGAFARGEQVEGVVRGLVKGSLAPPLVFLLTGQGTQHVGMGRQLYEAEPAFRQALDACFDAVDQLMERRLRDVMWGEGAPIDQTMWTQPALFALEVALARLFQGLGAEPDALLGHSVGEIVAAHLAGVLSLEDAALLVVERGRLMQALPEGGAMASIAAPEAEVAQLVDPHRDQVDISGVNGPSDTVISGASAAVDEIVAAFEGRGVRVRRLTVSHAFHSPLMDPMLDAYEDLARTLTYHPARIPVISNIDGKDAGSRLQDPRYWRQHVRRAVRFADGVQTLLDDDVGLFLELGPRPVLTAMGARIAGERPARFVATLHPDRDDETQFAQALGALWTAGVPVDLRARHAGGPRAVMPTMAWQGERYWLEGPTACAAAAGEPLLGVSWVPVPHPAPRARGTWRVIGDDELADVLQERGPKESSPAAPSTW
ncbi:MAG: type I polyketide synthase [Myxococcota bacterium]